MAVLVEPPFVPFLGGGIAGGRHGQALSLEDAVRFWCDHHQTEHAPRGEKLPNRGSDNGTRIERDAYTGGKQGSEVVTYVIENGGHTWPGGPQYAPVLVVGKTAHAIDASQVIWEFFKRHPALACVERYRFSAGGWLLM